MRLGDLDELKNAIQDIYEEVVKSKGENEAERALLWCIGKIDNAPTISLPGFKEGYKQAIIDGKTNFSRPQGKWITVKQDTIIGCFEVNNKVCDQCNHATKYEYPFCPWCGADMQKGGAE